MCESTAKKSAEMAVMRISFARARELHSTCVLKCCTVRIRGTAVHTGMIESKATGSARTMIQNQNFSHCHNNGHHAVALTFRTAHKSQNGRHAVNLEETGAHLRLIDLKNREPVQSVHCQLNEIRHHLGRNPYIKARAAPATQSSVVEITACPR